MTLEDLRSKLRAPAGPILDVHVHPASAFGPYSGGSPEDDARHLLDSANRAGVSHLVLFSLHPTCPRRPTVEQFREANDLCLRSRDVDPEHLLSFCYVNPEYPDEAKREIDRCIGEHKMVGLKLWVALRASDKRVIDVVQHATGYGVPILQHAWIKTTGNLEGESFPDDVARLARAVPEAHIIMAHLNGIGPRGIERVQATTNVYVDCSGGDPERGIIDLACRRLGYQRVIFGSDAPIRSYGVMLGKVLASSLTEKQQRAVLWNNAVKLLPSWAPVHQEAVA